MQVCPDFQLGLAGRCPLRVAVKCVGLLGSRSRELVCQLVDESNQKGQGT
jgi:hypothetical protein